MFLSRDEVRELDRRAFEEYGVPSMVLMENAGRNVAELLISLGVKGPVCVCCGKGNNGGDGFVVARHLDIHQIPVRVLLFAEPQGLSGDAARNYEIIRRTGIATSLYAGRTIDWNLLQQEMAEAEWIVDALFGTGLTGSIRDPFVDVVAAINASQARVLAVDIPSGLDCDTGEPFGPVVRADHTVTFVAAKKGFAAAHAQAWLGQVHIAGIGAPRCLVEAYLGRDASRFT